MTTKGKLPIDLKWAIVCDDVRREDNGKDIVIGIYSASIIVPRFPAALIMCFWLQFEPLDLGRLDLHLRLIGGEDVEFGQAQMAIDVKAKELTAVSIKGIPVNLQAPIVLNLQIKNTEGGWETIRSIPVTRGPVRLVDRK